MGQPRALRGQAQSHWHWSLYLWLEHCLPVAPGSSDSPPGLRRANTCGRGGWMQGATHQSQVGSTGLLSLGLWFPVGMTEAVTHPPWHAPKSGVLTWAGEEPGTDSPSCYFCLWQPNQRFPRTQTCFRSRKLEGKASHRPNRARPQCWGLRLGSSAQNKGSPTDTSSASSRLPSGVFLMTLPLASHSELPTQQTPPPTQEGGHEGATVLQSGGGGAVPQPLDPPASPASPASCP